MATAWISTSECSVLNNWKEALSSYEARIESLNKTEPYFIRFSLIHQRNPNPLHRHLRSLQTHAMETHSLQKWKSRLLDFMSSLDDSSVKSASEKAFKSLPDLTKAVSELTALKGVGPATASAVLAAYAL